jgi:hypothetical protein
MSKWLKKEYPFRQQDSEIELEKKLTKYNNELRGLKLSRESLRHSNAYDSVNKIDEDIKILEELIQETENALSFLKYGKSDKIFKKISQIR